MQLDTFFTTIVASAIGTALAAFIGFRVALAKLRRDTAFSRALEWHEKAAKAFMEAAHAIDAALAKETIESDVGSWEAVYIRMAALRLLGPEAELYAKPDTYSVLFGALEDFAAVSDVILSGREHGQVSDSDLKQLWHILAVMQRHAGSRLADDVRKHLGLTPIQREPHLYDKKFLSDFKKSVEQREKQR